MTITTLLLAALAAGGPPVLQGETDGEWEALVELACIDCHSGARTEGGVDLRAALDAPREALPTWERALRRVHAREMPPGGGLEDDDHAEWTRGLFAALGVDGSDPGRPTLRRLTRSQARNVLDDLVGLEVDVERFLPRDASGYGFDTTGDTLFVSPESFEQWYELADAVLAGLEARGRAPMPLDPDAGPDAVGEGIARFLGRAFRRPATGDEVSARVELYRSALFDGASRAVALEEVVRSALLSPKFMFRPEADRPEGGGPWRVTDHELANRLSFFLWGTAPDPGLTALADAGTLSEAEVLEAELTRMLASPRSRWLATDFAGQWLGFAELDDVTPDVRRFGAFDEALRRDMRNEAVAFFDDLVRSDRSALECLDTRFAFLNQRLAAHYGIAGVEHRDIRRIEIQDRARGGVLGMGAVLTITSTPLRTSPVQRGQWVLERLLASPAPPPPPDAGTLPEDDRQGYELTLRARLEQHRADPRCAACHARMDPYGLALERFDGIGGWRSGDDSGPAIDARVTLPGGTTVDGPGELKGALAARPGPFAQALAEALFVYAVGRPPTIADQPALSAVVEGARREDYRFSSFVRGIVATRAFTHRRLPR